MFSKIENIILLGIKVSFNIFMNQIEVEMIKDEKVLTQCLPFDHLYEQRVCDLLDWMRNEILKD
jgi:hypothetical protein